VTTYSGNLLQLWPLYNDQRGRKDWMLQHWLRHLQYTQALAFKGVNIYTPDLSIDMTQDWFSQHYLLHTQLDQVLDTGQAQALSLIDVSSVDNSNDYDDYQSNNAFLHGTIEQALGIH
jgi:hypothetical protein